MKASHKRTTKRKWAHYRPINSGKKENPQRIETLFGFSFFLSLLEMRQRSSPPPVCFLFSSFYRRKKKAEGSSLRLPWERDLIDLSPKESCFHIWSQKSRLPWFSLPKCQLLFFKWDSPRPKKRRENQKSLIIERGPIHLYFVQRTKTKRGGVDLSFQSAVETQTISWIIDTQRGMLPGVSRERNLRSKIWWFTEFCNSHYVSHFAAFFIVPGTKISIAKRLFFGSFLIEFT